MADPIETSELLAFVRAVEVGSLSRAAAELGVPRATVSRRLQRLEQRLATRLLRRTTRSLALTPPGETFYRHARLVLDAVEGAEASVRHAGGPISGDLRVSVPPMLEAGFFAMLVEFARAHPAVRLQVHFSSRHVDLRRDGYDVAIRASTTLEPGLVARTLGRMPLVAVASPDYLAEHGTPRRRQDLARHRCLLGFARGELPQSHWPIGGAQVHVEGSFFTNEVTLLADAAVRGLGIALVPRILVESQLARGALVQVLPGVLEGESRISVVYPERELVPPQVRAFVDTVVAWAPSHPSLSPAKPTRARPARSPREPRRRRAT
ncbi:LysR family transcriptional regulator [Paraliomyxa miuraensis]|uniref:LysR family transcriptional regulator n=1 Tax=Paraliomyxa miuraensis TaxID=376150 RepID=UPI00225B191D|nr:LysR family transcriptional regulator [Paraliomyxa miuraensis]MCX4242289.1 LysR family transcriptional regulator [Paraliomyxa miuraensis]